MTPRDNGRALILAMAEPRPSRCQRIARAVLYWSALGVLICGGVLTIYYLALAIAAIARWATVVVLT